MAINGYDDCLRGMVVNHLVPEIRKRTDVTMEQQQMWALSPGLYDFICLRYAFLNENFQK